MSRLSKVTIQNFLNDYAAGTSIKQVAKKYGISPATVHRWMTIYGVKARNYEENHCKPTYETTIYSIPSERFIQIVNDSTTYKDICDTLQIPLIQRNRVTIKKRCKELGIIPQWLYAIMYAMEDLTKDELAQRYDNWWASNVRIRKKARELYLKSNKPQCCAICGYSKAIEVSHIRPVADFPGNTLIRDINDINNLIALCPNHHWEFDHNCLDKENVQKIYNQIPK